MKIEINNINPGILDKKNLLDELAIDIANKFGIEKSKAIQLINEKTISGIEGLKNELNNKTNKLDNNELEKLFFTIKGAHELISNYSKIEINTLKEDVEKSINLEDFKSRLESYLPINLIIKAKNPKNVHEHILGFALGSSNSLFTTLEYLYKIGKGIISTPYHLYMIISGKSETHSFKDI